MGRFNSEQRTKILEAAIRVFARQGLAGGAIRLVGQEAGVNSALLYYYFENKEVLFREAIREVIRGLLERLREKRAAIARAEERIDLLIDVLLDYYEQHPERMLLMSVVVSLYPEFLGEVFQDLVDERLLLPLEILLEGVNRNELRPIHPAVIWWSMMGMCLFQLHMRKVIGHVNTASLPMPAPTMEETRRQLKDILKQGLIPMERKPGAEPGGQSQARPIRGKGKRA